MASQGLDFQDLGWPKPPLFLGKHVVQMNQCFNKLCSLCRKIQPRAYPLFYGAFHGFTQEMPVPVQAFNLFEFIARPGWRVRVPL